MNVGYWCLMIKWAEEKRIRVAELLLRVEGQRKDHKGDKKQRDKEQGEYKVKPQGKFRGRTHFYNWVMKIQ